MVKQSDNDGLVFLLDVGSSMSTKLTASSTYLQSCADIIQMIVQRKMFQSSKDEVALILFGSNETANVLHEADTEYYRHINVARPLGLCDWKLLEFIQNNVATSGVIGDIVEGLIVAANHFVEDNNKQKSFKEKRIIVFTDFSSTADDESQLDLMLKNLKREEIRIDVISPFSEVEDEQTDASNGHHKHENNDATTSKQNGHSSIHKNHQKPISKHQKKIQSILHKTCTRTDGSMYSFNEALKVLSVYQAKAIRSAGTKYTFTIGNSFKMPIVSLIKTKECKPDIFRFKKVHAKDENAEVKTDRACFTKDDEKRALEKEDLVNGYRYGSTNVPIDDIESTKLKPEKCFSLLGFTKSETIKRDYFLGDSVNQIMPDGANEKAEEAFASMVHAMWEENMYGVVRRVFSSRSAPELGCLIPYITVDNVCLYYIALPFDDDVRKFRLESFRPKHEPTEKQLSLIDDLIDNMDLTVQNEDDEEEELYDPHTVFNPYIQRMFQSIALRATQPEAEIPDFDRHLTSANLIEMEKKIKTEKTLDILKRCAEQFPTKVLTKKIKKNDESIFADEKTKEEEEKQENKVNNMNLDEILSIGETKTNQVKRVGTITPVDDFRLLAERACVKNEDDNSPDFEEICLQIQMLIKDLINESLMQLDENETSSAADKLQEKTAECIRVQREYCVRLNMPGTYNTYIKALKVFLLKFNSNNKYAKQIEAFWSRYFASNTTANLSLISSLECKNSDVTNEMSEEFASCLKKDENGTIAQTSVTEEQNEEDLLDMM